ncbi:MAG: glycoside hydrolase family 5 protein [Croceivirga sp.]
MKTYLMPVSLLNIAAFLMVVSLSCSANNESEPDSDAPSDPVTQQPDHSNGINSPLNSDQATSGAVRNISVTDFVDEMGIGWNLGNSMDVEDIDKTAWGNPLPTAAMIEKIAERGFSTLRIPVTWSYHQGSGPEYAIEISYLERIQALVDKALSLGMHVIINTHHEDPWVIPTTTQADMVKPRLSSLWTQIAEQFKMYGDYLIFETLNEPRHEGSAEEWAGGTPEGRQVVNTYHKTCLEAIRSTGGNNTRRFIMISTYAASSLDVTMNDLEVPNNDPNTIISIHSYFPFDFTLNPNGGNTWGTQNDIEELKSELERIYLKWIVQEQKPVILGEWGTTFKNNNSSRVVYAKTYIEESLKRGLKPILWDNGLENELGIFNRQSLDWKWHEAFVDAIIASSTK